MSGEHAYSRTFFDYLDRSSGASAEAVVGRIELGLPVESVLDVGCGRGAWLAAWGRRGVSDVFGIDGPYVDASSLLVPESAFAPLDVGRPFDLGRRFDLVQCLEVAEHIEDARAGVLLENLARHGDAILFSAATPGQGGEHHVNERPLEDWAERLHDLGYRCFDCIRPQLEGLRRVEPWYRYNTLLFVRADVEVAAGVAATERAPGEALRVFASPAWRLRSAIVGALPYELVNSLARLKHAVRARLP